MFTLDFRAIVTHNIVNIAHYVWSNFDTGIAKIIAYAFGILVI